MGSVVRTRFERLALWGSVAVLVGSVLPWATEDGSPVWGIEGLGVLTLLAGLVAFWLALNWRSPVGVGAALAGALVVWVLGVVLAAAAFDSLAVTVFVVPVGAAVGIRGAVGQAPAR